METKIEAKITGSSKIASKYGGHFYYIYFKGFDGKAYRTCADPKCRNFKKWEALMKTYNETKKEIWITDMNLKKDSLIDADSPIRLSKRSKA